MDVLIFQYILEMPCFIIVIVLMEQNHFFVTIKKSFKRTPHIYRNPFARSEMNILILTCLNLWSRIDGQTKIIWQLCFYNINLQKKLRYCKNTNFFQSRRKKCFKFFFYKLNNIFNDQRSEKLSKQLFSIMTHKFTWFLEFSGFKARHLKTLFLDIIKAEFVRKFRCTKIFVLFLHLESVCPSAVLQRVVFLSLK